MTTWSSISDNQSNWTNIARLERWLLGEQPSTYALYAGARVPLGAGVRIGGNLVNATSQIEDKNSAWSEVAGT